MSDDTGTTTTATPVAAAPAAPAAVIPGAAVVTPVSAAAVLGEAAASTATAAPALSLPGKDATPEVWAKYYDDIGAPKDAAGYDLPVPDGVDPAFSKTAAAWMANHRLMPEQAKGLAADWNAFVTEQKATATAQAQARETERITALDAKHRTEEAALKNEWGQNHDVEMSYASKGAVQFIKPFAGEKSADVIVAIENVLGYGATVRLLHSIGKGLGEASARGLGSVASGTDHSEEARAARLYPSTAKK